MVHPASRTSCRRLWPEERVLIRPAIAPSIMHHVEDSRISVDHRRSGTSTRHKRHSIVFSCVATGADAATEITVIHASRQLALLSPLAMRRDQISFSADGSCPTFVKSREEQERLSSSNLGA